MTQEENGLPIPRPVMLQTGLDIRPVITHRYHYTVLQVAFEHMRSGQSGKIILEWS
jgi:threonine 3-dehydrogenase